jgi:hypothetical protein
MSFQLRMDRLFLKGERVVTPEAQRSDVIERIHQAHQDFEKFRLRAKSYFGQTLTRTSRLECKDVRSARRVKTHKQKRHWSHMRFRPTRPWQVIGTDLFTWNKDDYLLICDYYSKFPIVKKYQGDNLRVEPLSTLPRVYCQNTEYRKSLFQTTTHV